MKPPFSPDLSAVPTFAWPASLSALRQLFSGRHSESSRPASSAAESFGSIAGIRRTAPPEPVVTPEPAPFSPPAPPSSNFRIHCLPPSSALELSGHVKLECEQQEALGYALSSRFSHDGNVFLIFKRK